MTKIDLLASMERIMPGATGDCQTNPVKLPMAAIFAAAHAFVHEKDDDADARNVKDYLLALENDGYYSFEGAE